MVTKTDKWTAIKITKELKKRMDKLKVHHRQSYGEVIEGLMERR